MSSGTTEACTGSNDTGPDDRSRTMVQDNPVTVDLMSEEQSTTEAAHEDGVSYSVVVGTPDYKSKPSTLSTPTRRSPSRNAEYQQLNSAILGISTRLSALEDGIFARFTVLERGLFELMHNSRSPSVTSTVPETWGSGSSSYSVRATSVPQSDAGSYLESTSLDLSVQEEQQF